MRNVLAICKRELLSFFVSPVAYFVICGFVLLGGYFFFNLLGTFNLLLARYSQMPFKGPLGQLNLNQFVIEGLFHTLLVILVFLIPLLTMRIVAEERHRGTFELLVTSPLTVFEIVLGKFLGVGTVVLIMLVGILFFPLMLWLYGSPGPEMLPVFSGFLGLLLCSLGFASIGMAVSSFTENQIVAGVSSMVVLLLLYVIHAPAESLGGVGGDVLTYLSPVMQVRDMFRGVITLKALIYFFSLIFLGLFLSQRALDAYRWR
ncbi:MAG: ABC transporter permease subunit [Oligoflexia bacterium]|nr:ABC transporter permease subunit [Oligoflexia bacterium]